MTHMIGTTFWAYSAAGRRAYRLQVEALDHASGTMRCRAIVSRAVEYWTVDDIRANRDADRKRRAA